MTFLVDAGDCKLAAHAATDKGCALQNSSLCYPILVSKSERRQVNSNLGCQRIRNKQTHRFATNRGELETGLPGDQ
eukprot:525873-Amphidinium_carterae.6